MKQPVIFIDRDGTTIEERGYLSDPDDVRLVEGATEAICRLKGAGYAVVMLTNQSGVARGYFGLAAVEKIHQRIRDLLSAAGTFLDGIYYCPHLPEATHSPFGGVCLCRKPYPGMALEAASVLKLDLERAFIVGDKLDDMGLANRLGVPGVLVRTGYGRDSEFLLGRAGAPKAHIVVPNIMDATDWILTRKPQGA